MNYPGIGKQRFEITFGTTIDTCNWIKKNDVITYPDSKNYRALHKPRKNSIWIDILYYITLGWIDKRGYYYKVKVEEI